MTEYYVMSEKGKFTKKFTGTDAKNKALKIAKEIYQNGNNDVIIHKIYENGRCKIIRLKDVSFDEKYKKAVFKNGIAIFGASVDDMSKIITFEEILGEGEYPVYIIDEDVNLSKYLLLSRDLVFGNWASIGELTLEGKPNYETASQGFRLDFRNIDVIKIHLLLDMLDINTKKGIMVELLSRDNKYIDYEISAGSEWDYVVKK